MRGQRAMHGLRRISRLRLVQRKVIAEVAIAAAHLLHLLQTVHIGLIAKSGKQHHGFELAVVERGLRHTEHGCQARAAAHGVERPLVARAKVTRSHRPTHQQLRARTNHATQQAAQRPGRGAADVKLQQIVIFRIDRRAGHGEIARDFLPIHLDHDLDILAGRKSEGNALHVGELDVQPQRENILRQRLQRHHAAQQFSLGVRDQIVAIGQPDGDVFAQNGTAGQNDAAVPLRIRQCLGVVFFQLDLTRFEHALARTAFPRLARITNRHLMPPEQLQQILVGVGKKIGFCREDVNAGHGVNAFKKLARPPQEFLVP